jgi:hypothetical protein
MTVQPGDRGLNLDDIVRAGEPPGDEEEPVVERRIAAERLRV